MDRHSGAALSQEGRDPIWVKGVALVTWLLAGVVAFLPFARNTSPWNAVTLRVPGDQGNWWHVLIGAPFFLAYPMIGVRLRLFFSKELSSVMSQRLIWIAVGLSIGGTVLVELPFLLHLAGTSEWQRLVILGLGFGTILISASILFVRRGQVAPTRACLVGLDTAYLANVALCLVVYSEATGGYWSRAGWLISVVIVWPMAVELIWLLIETYRVRGSHSNRPGANPL